MKYLLLITCLFLAFNAEAKNFSGCDFIIYNQCVMCDEPLAFEVGDKKNCTNRCPSRKVNFAYSGSGYNRINCELKECPADKPYKNEVGSCFASKSEVKILEEEGIHEFYSSLEFDTEAIEKIKNNYLNKMVNDACPADFPLKTRSYIDKDTPCYRCDYPLGVFSNKTECDKCSNREFNANKCTIKCPKNKPLVDWNNGCHACDEDIVIRLGNQDNIDYSQICPNRVAIYTFNSTTPSVIKCPEEKPLIDRNGVCHACNETQSINLMYNEDKCAKYCPKTRELKGIWCQLRQQQPKQ